MTEIFVSSSALIIFIILVRILFRRKLPLRLRYALWALVALRLLIPVSLFSLPFSLSSLLEKTGLPQAIEDIRYAPERISTVGSNESHMTPEEYADEIESNQNLQKGFDSAAPIQVISAAEADEEYIREKNLVPYRSYIVMEIETYPDHFAVLKYVWYIGMVIIGSLFIISNIRLDLKLCKASVPLDTESPLPVRSTPNIISPCLFGLLHPVIYVTPDCADDQTKLRHIIAHECTHYRHGDQLWGLLRCICLTIWWFNPLVWLAAFLSRRDCELACDESTILRLGENERIAYGRTLVDMVARAGSPSDFLHNSTTMTGSKKSITERISLIAKKTKTTVSSLILVLLAVILVTVFTFTGTSVRDTELEIVNTEDTFYQSELPE